MSAAQSPIPFSTLQNLASAQGLDAVATIALPTSMDPRGLEQTISDGVGDMTWLMSQRDLRREPQRLLPGASHALVAALAYQREPAQEDLPGGLRGARYAAGKDYHGIFRRRLASIGREIELAQPGASTRACVDSAPLNERSLAELAGIGWLGRNGLIIDPRRGSYRFIGVLLTSAALEIRLGGGDSDRCGRCQACHQACPTGALVGRRVISTRCISYLTIEHQGVIPRHLAEHFGGWWYGCDICQEVCPWNRFAPPAGDQRLEGRDHEPHLLQLRADTFDAYFAGRAQRRLGWSRFRRNLLVALWSQGRLDEAQSLLDSQADGLLWAQAQELGIISASAGDPPGDGG